MKWYALLKDTLKAFGDFQDKQKCGWSNAFWYIKVCIFWKCVQYTIDWDKAQMLKKFSSDKASGTKNTLFSFVSSNSSQFYFQFAILAWAKVEGSSLKNFVGFSIFDSVLLSKFIFLFNKMHGLLDFKTS